jgi:TonB family protein
MTLQPVATGLFSPLSNWKTPWTELLLGYGSQAIVVAILVWLPVLDSQILETPARNLHVVELVPAPLSSNPAPQHRPPQPVLAAKRDPLPTALRLPALPKVRPKFTDEDTPAPPVRIVAKPMDALPPSPARAMPQPYIRTNVFSPESSSPQIIRRAPQGFQAGSFGDPNGLPATTTPARPVNISQAGAFDLPSGPGNIGGNGNRSATRSVVNGTGFSSGVATGNPHPAVASTQTRPAGFGNSNAPAPAVPSRPAAPSAAKITPAEILSKPAPVYTEEARNQRVEGEVLLEVVLEASGRLRVLRVVRGLGHGLDDAAVRAAQRIRFKPAIRDGQPSDSTAVVHIIFQLA